MRDADAFEETAFIGLARSAKRDSYRLSLFGQHLGPNERPLVILPIQGGTLIVTDDRVLELRAHLEVQGAWNVRQFQGYAVHQTIERRLIRDTAHEVIPGRDAAGNRWTEDRLRLETDLGPAEFLVSKGPAATLYEEEFHLFRGAILGNQPK